MYNKMRNTLCVLLAVILVASCMAVGGFAEGNETPVSRYTVLVLDTSGATDFSSGGVVIYTADTAINYVKQAASKFLDDILCSKGNNYVAIVSFKSVATVVSDFSSNATELKEKVNALSSSERVRDISAGLSKANSLLSGITSSNTVKKNVVLFTTGMTNNGSYSYNGKYNESTVGSSWHRKDTDVKLYAYANNAITVADTLKQQANLYSIGLFRTFDNMPEKGKGIVSFFKLTAKDLASSEDYFYEVNDPNDLIFTFGDVAEDITNNDYPIIIIPGIMGSNLYFSPNQFNSNTKVWAPSGSIPSQLWTVGFVHMLAMDSGYKMYTKPYENQNAANVSREYGAVDNYKEVVDRVCQEFPNREVYFFSYDFRQSNVDTAKCLNSFIQEKGFKKVDLVCHSMGGLVASHYVNLYGSGCIDKIITCGTPYEGSPMLLNTVLNWDILEPGTPWNIGDNLLGSVGGLTKKVKSAFPAVAELSSTENYVRGTDYIWAKYDHTETSGWFGLGGWTNYYTQLSYSQYSDICRTIFGNLYDTAKANQDSLNRNGYNVLTTLDNTYFILGTGQSTISSLYFNDGNSLSSLECNSLKYENIGDGTVPYYSASVMSKLESLDNKENRVFTFNTNHGGTIGHEADNNSDSVNQEAQKALNAIISILKNQSDKVQSSDIKSEPYIVVRIACPVDAQVTYNGETLSSTSNMAQTASFGRMDIISQNGDIVKMLCLNATDEDYNIEINGTGSGTMDYEISWYDENNQLIKTNNIDGVSISETTLISTTTDKNNTELKIDNDGDGVVDEILAAKKSSSFFNVILNLISVFLQFLAALLKAFV